MKYQGTVNAERASIYALSRPETEASMATRALAERHKRMIEAYWAERGAVVEIRLVEAGFSPTMRSKFYELQSDMVNALPKQQTKAVLPKKAA